MSRISITEAKVKSDGSMSAYVQYSVALKAGGAVKRRYREFQWLRGALHAELPGSIVPILPSKSTTGNLDPTFVSERREALERFLQKIDDQDGLCDAQCFATFLTSPNLEKGIMALNSSRWKADEEATAAALAAAEEESAVTATATAEAASSEAEEAGSSGWSRYGGSEDADGEKPAPVPAKKSGGWGFSALAAAVTSAASSAASAASASASASAASSSAAAAAEELTPMDKKMGELLGKTKSLERQVGIAMGKLDTMTAKRVDFCRVSAEWAATMHNQRPSQAKPRSAAGSPTPPPPTPPPPPPPSSSSPPSPPSSSGSAVTGGSASGAASDDGEAGDFVSVPAIVDSSYDASSSSPSSSSSSSSASPSASPSSSPLASSSTELIPGISVAVAVRCGETLEAAHTARQEHSILARALTERVAVLAATKDALAVREALRKNVGKRRAELSARSNALARSRSALTAAAAREMQFEEREKGEDSAVSAKAAAEAKRRAAEKDAKVREVAAAERARAKGAAALDKAKAALAEGTNRLMAEERRASEECGAALKAALLETVYANERLHQLQLARFKALQTSLQASAATIAHEQAHATPIAASNGSDGNFSSSSSSSSSSNIDGDIDGDGSGIEVSAPASQDIPSSSSSSVMLESEESLEEDEAAV